jgi:NAD(P)-dependent dehydrogenase (short-subunit alcohol dehydrogenase family)
VRTSTRPPPSTSGRRSCSRSEHCRHAGAALRADPVHLLCRGVYRRPDRPALRGLEAGLHGLTHFLAARTTPFGVTVNALAPALIAETGLLPGDPQELRQQVPVGRLGHPDEVADLALAILRNPYLTNQVVSLDGGMYPR